MTDRQLLDLNGQVALITGAGQGVGRAIALQLARQGAGGIAVNDFVADRAEAVAQEVRALGVMALAVPFDVGDLNAVRAASETIGSEIGPVTLLVNNAGMAGPNAQLRPSNNFWEEDPQQWDKFLRTNLYGVFNCCHAIIPGMVSAKRGRIVTIISDSARVGEPKQAVYSAAKAGAAGFVRSIAKEVGRYGITSNAVSLSAMANAMPEEALEGFMASEHGKAMMARYAIRRMGKPDDVAAMVAFLCSDAAEWITGQTYPVNGGYSFAV